MISGNDSFGGSKAAQELQRKRAAKILKALPVLHITHAEFATIHQVGSNEEISDLVKAGHTRLKMKGDCGNWFVCYPKENRVCLVKFIRECKRPRTN